MYKPFFFSFIINIAKQNTGRLPSSGSGKERGKKVVPVMGSMRTARPGGCWEWVSLDGGPHERSGFLRGRWKTMSESKGI